MPRAALQPREVAEFRERLTAIASRLFAERGYDGVTLRLIARELGCSPMTPYRYFRDKDEILAAIRVAAYEEFAAVQEAAVASTKPGLERLAALGRAYVGFGRDEPHAYRLMFGLSQPDAGRFAELQDASARAWAPLRKAIGEAIDAGVLAGDPDTVAHVFWAGVHGIVSLSLAGKLAHGCSLDDLVRPMLGTLARGNRTAQAP